MDWFAKQVAFADRTDGDIDTLANRIAHIRTWTFVSNRADWLADPEHWQERTRAIEDSLSDALHEQLTQRFVDRRTSALMKRPARRRTSCTPRSPRTAPCTSRSISSAACRASASSPTRRPRASTARPRAMRPRTCWPRSSPCARAAWLPAKSDAFKLTPRGRVLWRERGDRPAGGGRGPAQAHRRRPCRRAPDRPRQGEGAGAPQRLARRDSSASG